MNTALWIVQCLLAVMFLFAGFTKFTQSKVKLEKQFSWVKDYSISMVRLIGLAEILGSFGLIIPWMTGIATIITPLAAVGFCIIMVLAANMAHLNKKEYKEVAMNIFLFLMAAFVAYGRF